MIETTSSRLKQIMDERNLRQSDILALAKPYCEQYGVKLGKSDLSQFISGKVIPGQWKLTILGLALDVSETWLMGLDVPRNRIKNENKPIPNIEDELDEGLIERLCQLTPQEQEKVDAFVQGLLASR